MLGIDDTLKTISTIIGGAAIASVIGYKLLSGWFFTNMNLKLSAERIPDLHVSGDLLVVKIELEKGGTDALRLDVLEVRLRPAARDEDVTKERGAQRKAASYRRIDTRAVRRESESNWLPLKDDSRAFALAPGDRTEFATSFVIAKDELYTVELLVFGRANVRRWSESQWRASLIVPPRVPQIADMLDHLPAERSADARHLDRV